MAILDVFKKKEGEKAEAEVKIKKKEAKKAPKVKVEEKPKVEKKNKKTSAVYDILKEPYITEKGTDLSQENKYVFKVYDNANKIDIKKAIESLYNVNVISVRTVNIPRKKKRFGRKMGFKAGLRKAIIQIKEGQKIEIIAN